MKRLLCLLLGAAFLFVSGMACQTTSYATLTVTNQDDLPVSFRIGSFTSSLDTVSGITDFAAKTYTVEVDPNGDKVKAMVWKTSVDTNELRLKLYYKEEIQDIGKTDNIIIPAYVECDIP